MSVMEKKWFFPSLLVAISILFLSIFFIDYHCQGAANSEGRDKVGRIIYKNNLVKRKLKSSKTWSRLNSNSAIYDLDIISADKLSGAEIYLKDGTHIKVDENSMFRLSLSKKQTKLSFKKGSVRIHQSEENDNSLIVNAGSRTIELNKSNAKLVISDEETEKDQKKLSLQVDHGNANVRNEGEDSSKIVLANQKAEFNSKGLKVSKVLLFLLEPKDQKVFVSETKTKNVQFSWKKEKEIRNLKLEVSYSRSFKKVLYTRLLSATQNKVNISFKRGVYYWRLRGYPVIKGKKAKILLSSNIYKFEVQGKNKFVLISPKDKTKFSYIEKKPNIDFNWSKVSKSYRYRLEISSAPNFLETIKSIELDTNQYSLTLEKGKYYWKVVAVPLFPDWKELKSKTRQLQIQKISKFLPPQAEFPSQRAKIKESSVQRGLNFRWSAMPELDYFEFILSKNSSFKKNLAHGIIDTSAYYYQGKLEAGNYYWNVLAKKNKNEKAVSKASFFFTVEKKIEQKSEPEPESEPEPTPEPEPEPELKRKIPDLQIPDNVHNFTLAQFRSYLKNDLSYECKKDSLPDQLILKCFPHHVILNLDGWFRLYLYYFFRMDNINLNIRYSGYSFFRENCNFKPAYELLEVHSENLFNKSLQEKEEIFKIKDAFDNCPKQN